MKRIIFIGLYLMSCICLVAQTAKTYTIAFDRDNFSIEKTDRGDIITSTTHELFYDTQHSTFAIPYKTINIILPYGLEIKDYSFTIDTIKTIENAQLCKVPQISTNEIGLDINTNIKSRNNNKTSLYVEYLGEEIIANQYIAKFKFPIIKYNEKLNYITWVAATNITLTMGKRENVNNNSLQDNYMIDLLRSIVINPEELNNLSQITRNNSRSSSFPQVKYLIVTNDSLKPYFEAFSSWKRTKGIKTEIITIEEIYDRYPNELTDKLKIKRCLFDYYINSSLQFVLLGGDEFIIPTQSCYADIRDNDSVITQVDDKIPTDLFYACFDDPFDWNGDGDNIIGEFINDSINITPQIYICRVPVRTPSDVDAFITKSINYELTPPMDNWCNKYLSVGNQLNKCQEDQSDTEIKNERMYMSIKEYWPQIERVRFYDTATDFEGGASYELSPDNLQEQLANSYHHIHITCHGDPDHYKLEDGQLYDTVYAAQLTSNTPKIIVTTSCLTNAFDALYTNYVTEPCLSEVFMRNPNNGVVAYMGSSSYGFSYEEIAYTDPSTLINENFYKAIFNNCNRFGVAVALAKTSSLLYIPTEEVKWLTYSINPLGDPELPIYTDTPQKITGITWGVEAGRLLIKGNLEGCTVTLTSKADYGTSYFETVTGIRETAAFEMGIHNLDDFRLCITKENHIPLILEDLGSIFIQNKTFTGTNYINAEKNIYIGSNVTTLEEEGPVTIKSGKTTFDISNELIIKNNFECKKGATLEIK